MPIFLKRSVSALVIGFVTFGLAAGAMAASDSSRKTDRPVIIGTVSTISGTTLTVASKMKIKDREETASTTKITTYTINAANATVTKNNATSTLSAIAVGDTVMIQGVVSGTTVTATTIRDGIAKLGKMSEDKNNDSRGKSLNLVIQGNGQPVVGGSVTAISGTTLTIKNTSNVTYTIDALNAVIVKGNATSTLSNVAVGDSVIVQGAINGTSITATTVIDQGVPKIPNNSASSTPERRGGGFFNAIGGFFSRLFGF